MILGRLRSPVVLAPLGGGPSTPELAAAVSEAGGLGFLAASYLSADEMRERIAATRRLTGEPFGVNVFIPGPEPSDPVAYAAYAERVGEWARARGTAPGEPRWSDHEFDAKIDLLAQDPPAVASFTFGLPSAGVVERLRSAGAEVWITVTTPAEADAAIAAGADALVIQGAEAGGHQSAFADREDASPYGLLALLQLIGARHRVPLVAAGAVATGRGLAAVIAAGAAAAQVGTAFMLCPEAGTHPTHREALRTDRDTALTRAFSGRRARGIRNDFMAAHDAEAPIAYPEVHYLTAPLRDAAREAGDAEAINLWAGEAHSLAREAPAAEIVADLVREAAVAARELTERLAE